MEPVYHLLFQEEDSEGTVRLREVYEVCEEVERNELKAWQELVHEGQVPAKLAQMVMDQTNNVINAVLANVLVRAGIIEETEGDDANQGGSVSGGE